MGMGTQKTSSIVQQPGNARSGALRSLVGMASGMQLKNAAEPAALPCGRVGGLLTVEGGAVLGGRLDLIEELRRDGVRALTLTWNGANELGSGCETEEGLTPFGRRSVAALEQAGIAVDVSHLNDAGFRDLCAAAKRPFLATHSNARSICPVPRNLADWQICEIRDRGGIIGRVVNLKEDTVMIETGSDRTKIRVSRWAIDINTTAEKEK